MAGIPGAQEILALGDALLFLAVRLRLAALVHHVIARGDAQAHLAGGADRGVEEPVLVVEGGRAGADHFQAGDLGPPVDEIVVEVLLDLPDLVQPAVEDHILADAPHQGHGRVRMHIDETGNGDLAGAVHHLHVAGDLPKGTGAGRTDAADPALADQDVLPFIPDGNVLEQDRAHQRLSKSTSPNPSGVRCGISPWKQLSRM